VQRPELLKPLPLTGVTSMHKPLALALITLALASGVAVYSLEKPAPASACNNPQC
jgi:hypothetical protein